MNRNSRRRVGEQRFRHAPRTSPLSPTLSPEYREEGARFAALSRAMHWVACLAIVSLVAGCHAPRAGRALPAELSGSDPDAQFSYWQQLPDQPITSNDEAFHGLLLYVDGKDDAPDYAARVAALKERKWLAKGFSEPPEQGIKRGTLAVAVMRILKERGGLTTSLIGPVPRYATREMVFLDVFPPSSPNQVLSGQEFVGIMGRVEDFQRGNGDEVPLAAPETRSSKPETRNKLQ